MSAQCNDPSATITLWGKPYTLMIYATGDKNVRILDQSLILSCPIGSGKTERQRILDSFLRKTLDGAIREDIPLCEDITGRHASEWHIKKMKTRWGTCNIEDKRIWLSSELVFHDRECLRYVMIHELTHLYERLHNDRFKTYMDMFMPNWRDVKKKA